MESGTVPDGMVFTSDIHFGTGGGAPLFLDLMQPDPRPSGLMPAIVWVHGGGWRAGDKYLEPYESIGWDFVRAGYTSLSVNYRLSQEAIFPAQIHDVKAAIRWLRANAGELGVDPARIGAWGHSAGGHLVALLGTSGDRPVLEGESGNPGYSSRVQAVVAVSPPTDFLAFPAGWTYEEPRSATTQLVGGTLEERRDIVQMANPITYADSSVPPFLIIHGVDDLTVPVLHADLLKDALEAAGADVTLIRLPHADHVLAAPALGIEYRDAWLDVGRTAFEFFQRHLGA